jgi:hypothetical protein
MVSPNARRLDGTVAEDIRFAHAALDWFVRGTARSLYISVSCHLFKFLYGSAFTVHRSPVGVWRSIVLILEKVGFVDAMSMRPAPGGEPL